VAAAAPMQGETVRLVVMAVLALLGALVRLVLLPSDERRQSIHVAIGWGVALR